MTSHSVKKTLDDSSAHHNAQWRDPAQVVGCFDKAVDTALLRYEVSGNWFDILAENEITLLVTREYEHLIIALSVYEKKPLVSYMQMPHPSGLVVDRSRDVVHVASTRNPNQIYDLAPVRSLLKRTDIKNEQIKGSPLIPVSSRFYPGCMYIHDIALIGKKLHANSVGQNAVVCLGNTGKRVWWPRCIETDNGPVFGQNHLQLNSIAAGSDLKSSYFSASTDKISARRPGHKNFPVDKRGVIFSGATREPITRGLTRPHSARLHDGKVWVDNSGYGEFGLIDDGKFMPITRLPGWTRGLCFHKHIAFVGTSRVIPQFSQYAPGIDNSLCGIHAIDTISGQVLGSLRWPYGNQIFAIDWIPSTLTSGFPYHVGRKRSKAKEKKIFYTFIPLYS